MTGLTQHGLELICDNFLRLEALTLGNGKKPRQIISGDKLSQLRKLRFFVIYNAPGFTDKSVERGIGSPSMEKLKIINCPLSDIGLRKIALNHGRLKNLELRRCENITHSGLECLIRNEPLLGSMILMNFDDVGDPLLEALEEHCPRLHRLDMINCGASDLAVEVFRERRPALSISWS